MVFRSLANVQLLEEKVRGVVPAEIAPATFALINAVKRAVPTVAFLKSSALPAKEANGPVSQSTVLTIPSLSPSHREHSMTRNLLVIRVHQSWAPRHTDPWPDGFVQVRKVAFANPRPCQSVGLFFLACRATLWKMAGRLHDPY